MNERRATDQRWMGAGDDERRALDGSADAEALSDSASEGRFPSAKGAGKHDQIARNEGVSQHPAEFVHFVARRNLTCAEKLFGNAHEETCRRGTRGPIRVTIS
ncbi:hypothetical protein FHX48_001829 [Microbacterium halimionae]|uniref:Uncharacterized protein n=1 Tax=Microbacterium halimionae TaxID=1526413 RepID=A0A7W3JPU1_9MICO|nr:hypothetical protein [Microbacterium halimionae]NII94968.1 hypothetical protein [Microbacterium halimionae]